MTNFIPEQPKTSKQVPYFDDVTSEDGWVGQTTGKSTESLKSIITQAISRLGGLVTGFEKGTFKMESGLSRDGYRITYTIESSNGRMQLGVIEIAALPVRTGRYSSLETRKEKSLKMALYMIGQTLNGLWYLEQLSPGYAPLMPFMIEPKSGKTITQLWSENATMNNLLPSGENDFIDAETRELK